MANNEIVWDPANPLSRADGESQKSNSALNDYWLMGSGRSLEKLMALYLNPTGTLLKEPPTKKINTLKTWSQKHGWQARIAIQKEIDDAIALERYRERHMSSDEVLGRLADQARADLADFAEVASAKDLKKLEQSPLVKRVVTTTRTLTNGEEITKTIIELHDAQKALEMLGKYHSLFTDKVDVQGSMNIKGYQVVSPDDWDDKDD